MRFVSRGAVLALLWSSSLAAQADPMTRVSAVHADSAERAHDRGQREEAHRWAEPVAAAWRAAGGGTGWSSAAHVVAGRAWRLLGDADPDAVRQALAAFDAATAADSTSVEGDLWASDLFLERYNAPDAEAGYRDVLSRDPDNARAWLGLARAAAFAGKPDAPDFALRSLAADSAYGPAHLFLARVHLEAEQYDSARQAAERGVALDSSAVDGWATLAAVAWLGDDPSGYAAAERRAKALHSRPAPFHVAIAEAAARHRRYADAVTFAAQAVALDSLDAEAWGVLGINQMRVGDIPAGRASLETAFRLDPFHVWHKNTLDLLDAMADFGSVKTERFHIVAPARDVEYLAAMLGPLLESAYDTLAMRYAHRPPTPIRLELFSRHADFSVRTIGLTGMGALGVSFGTVLAMDAPAARPPGSWNIGSTTWHELAHTFTLGASRQRVPRWVSEGLSVVEERRARPGWGAHASLAFVTALHEGALLPIARLNEGFTRPRAPGQLVLSYYHASLVCEMLEADFGIAGVRALLTAYGDGLDTEAALAQATGLSLDSLEARFNARVRARFATPLAALDRHPDDLFGAPMRLGVAALAAEDADAAVAHFREARDRFPEYGGADGPHAGLARALLLQHDTTGALAALAEVTTRDETAAEANALEAALRLATADTVGAQAALGRVTWINPADLAVRRQLADLAAARDDHAVVVRERRVIAALNRVDPLGARTDLAEALLAAGDVAAARNELLTVLEAAPRFERAQLLLLDAREAARGGGTP